MGAKSIKEKSILKKIGSSYCKRLSFFMARPITTGRCHRRPFRPLCVYPCIPCRNHSVPSFGAIYRRPVIYEPETVHTSRRTGQAIGRQSCTQFFQPTFADRSRSRFYYRVSTFFPDQVTFAISYFESSKLYELL